LADRRVNVLLLGGDAAPDREGVRTDTMILVSVDPVSGDTAMFSVPRNMRQVPIPEGHPAYDVWDCHCYPDLINALYQTGLNRPESFPGGPNTGANAIMTVLSSLYGIDIHHYAFVDLLGFVAVVDALGGLDITVTEWVVDEEYIRPDLREVDVNYVPGRTYHMDGNEALAYARIRRNSSDYYRMGRQRCVLQAAAQQANPVNLIRSLPELVDALQGALLTDIPVAEWPAFIELAAASDAANAVTVRFMPYAPELKGTGLDYNAGWVNGGYPTPNVNLIRSTVRTVISTPAPDAAVEIGVQPLGDICGTA
jgi:LCP family protein required for cell wall assembly